jgi:hypothetical protein
LLAFRANYSKKPKEQQKQETNTFVSKKKQRVVQPVVSEPAFGTVDSIINIF